MSASETNKQDNGPFEFDDEDEKPAPSSEFARLLEDSFKSTRKSLAVGDKVRAEILSAGKDDIFVSTGTMHDGIVPRKDLLDPQGNLSCKVGDKIDLYVTHARGSEIYLSPNPTSRNLADDLEDAFDKMLPVEGRVTEVCKGGFRVQLMGKTAFCPISQMDFKRIEKPEEYVGQRFEFRITQITERGRNIVVSRRRVLEEQRGLSESGFVEKHHPGDVVQGRITRIEPFGAFVEVAPGIDGLAHISELRWSRVSNPHDVVTLGQEVSAKILKIEEVEGRLKISLSLKQVEGEPWQNLPPEIRPGHVVEGKVTRCVKFGAFVELAPGVEGLLPLSEMSYTRRVVRSDELVHEGDRITVMIKEIQPAEHRISLALPQDPERDEWRKFTPAEQASGSFGTLGDKLRQAMDKKKPSG